MLQECRMIGVLLKGLFRTANFHDVDLTWDTQRSRLGGASDAASLPNSLVDSNNPLLHVKIVACMLQLLYYVRNVDAWTLCKDINQ